MPPITTAVAIPGGASFMPPATTTGVVPGVGVGSLPVPVPGPGVCVPFLEHGQAGMG